METMVIHMAHLYIFALLCDPNAVPAPANARGIVKQAGQKSSLTIFINYSICRAWDDRRKDDGVEPRKSMGCKFFNYYSLLIFRSVWI